MIKVQAGLGKKSDPISKISRAKRVGMAQAVEHLPSKCKALESKPQYHQRKKKSNEREREKKIN
jgi:hypothetical protein